jgi:hypothetical protein
MICPYCENKFKKEFINQVTCASEECQRQRKLETRRQWYKDKRARGEKTAQDYSKKVDNKKDGDVFCLKCDCKFHSPNKSTVRICPRCSRINEEIHRGVDVHWSIR